MGLLPVESRQIRHIQSKFLDGHDLPRGLVASAVQKSWTRLRESGVKPTDRAIFEIPSSDISHKIEENRKLLTAALPPMEALYRALNAPAWTVLCADLSGLIIRSICDPSRAPAKIAEPLRQGRTIHEAQIGTNAPACVLTEAKPVIVRRSEHFLFDLDIYVCAAAPIFDVSGRLMAVLDATGADIELQENICDQVELTARTIENRMFHQLDDVYLIGFHFMPNFLETPAEGLIAISKLDGSIVGVNHAALRMLCLSYENLLGKSIGLVFATDVLSSRDNPSISYSVAGQLFYCRRYGKHDVRTISPRALKNPPSNNIVHDPSAIDPAIVQAENAGSRAIMNGLPILVRGETGSGKEVLARRLHDSRGGIRPFVAVNCSAIPESLIEAEIFGYADGAFTGARKGGSIGAIEQAHGGTLFLDEIGDASAALQAKLLRVLQEGTLTRVGSRQEIKVEFSVISATHRDLKSMVSEGLFREDLYYRLNGLTLYVPPLRDRSDVAEIVRSILRHRSTSNLEPELSSEAFEALLRYKWPGNIRQLSQALSAARALSSDSAKIELSDFPKDFRDELEADSCCKDSTAKPLASIHAEIIRKTLTENRNNISKTAKALDVSRTTVYKYLRLKH
ncbi:sigma-54-dependent Fis family transcriptional regulator [Sphingosinicella microcystinivorans]|uniref:sigma-54-dependent Fis family transcriptional regulator n=1 Tax=Sphingosinicella microcystinivorans TaxID=335406 RepID=UPI0022F3E7D2|nr:sigma-54-dependent Fis family transcriptional regulator [Sphingosinicella microcystinivorans]WBX85216.1 sigma-54-dependent Fis family transcriptional regulator [Sphingosinicella microcystinivorans]